ncbi:DUF4367 domain-containing protein [Paenibacillus sp. GCM10023252]|uniref:DUF4367 domain-containing protein n=1 Tax=Paenibacillus sp. GCM10023252 TaxID=3252649 RepID=UPI00360EE2F6
MKQEAEWDKLFDEAFEAAARQTSDLHNLDHKPSWDQLQSRLARHHRYKRRARRFLLISGAAASFIIGAILFGNPSTSQALNPFLIKIVELPGNLVTAVLPHNNGDESGAKTAPPPEYGGPMATPEPLNGQEIKSTESYEIPLEEARKRVNFRLPEFKDLPETISFTVASINYHPNEPYARHVALIFYNSSTKRNNTIGITQLGSDTATSMGTNSKHGTVEKVKLGSKHQGYLTTMSGRSKLLEFMKGDLYIHITGQMSKEEAYYYAEAMIKG